MIAHSQAASSALYGMVRFEEAYKKYVEMMIFIGPVARLSHTNSEIVKFASNNADFIKFTMDTLGI